MRARSRLAIAVTVLVTSAAVVGCGSGSPSTIRPEAPTSTSPPATTLPPESTTTSAPAVAATDTAVWPFAKDGTRYTDPVQAAKGFASTYLGFVSPVAGVFMQGDSRSGEVAIRAGATGPTTTVMVRQLGPDDTWWVLGASSPNLQLDTPVWNAAVSSPVTLSGHSTAFEATVNFEIRQDDTLAPLASGYFMGGANGEMGPFSKTAGFSQPTASHGAIILKTMSAEDGHIAEASVVRIQFAGLK